MSFDEDDGRIWRPGVDELRFVAGGSLKLRWRFDWRSFLFGIAAVIVVIVVAAVVVSFGTSTEPPAISEEPPPLAFNLDAGKLWQCICPQVSSFVMIDRINSGISPTDDVLTFIAGGEEIVRCTPLEGDDE